MKKSRIIVLVLAVAIMFLFTACNSTDYKNAVTLLEEGNYAEAITAFEALADYKDSHEKLEEAKSGLMREQVVELLSNKTWFFNGGSDSTVNNISFTEEAATIGQTYYDGNGRHDKEDVSCAYTVDSENIVVTLADGSELKISYTIKDDTINLGNNEYFTAKEVEEGLQGYWTTKENTEYGKKEYIYYYKNGNVKFEYASEAIGYNDGSYYYYGPKTGTYVMDNDGLSVDASNSWQFGFNIIDGEVAMVRCTSVCKRTSGFKGEDGYSF